MRRKPFPGPHAWVRVRDGVTGRAHARHVSVAIVGVGIRVRVRVWVWVRVGVSVKGGVWVEGVWVRVRVC